MKNSSSSRAQKTGAQLRDNRKSAKNDAKCVEKPIHHRHMTASRNNVNIFKCELRREAGTTKTVKICEILPNNVD